MSRLMDEVDAEFDALVAPSSWSCGLASGLSDPDRHPGPPSPPTAHAAVLELSAVSPRPATADASSSPSGPPSTSSPSPRPHAPLALSSHPPVSSSPAPTPSTAMSRTSSYGLRPPSPATPSLLALPPLARPAAVVAAAGGRAQRRRQNYQRASGAADQGLVQTSEAKYKAAGTNSISTFMGGFSKDSILGAAEEMQLVLAASDYMQLTRVRKALAGVLRRQPSTAEVAESLGCARSVLAARLEFGSRARATLAQRNYRLVVHIAKNVIRYMSGSSKGSGSGGGPGGGGFSGGSGGFGSASAAGNPLYMEDAIAAGMEGLMYAMEKFRPEAGCRLATYATWWIRQHVTRFVRGQQGVISLPNSAREDVERMVRTRAALSERLRRPPSDEELARELGVSADKLAQLEVLRRGVMGTGKSFEAPLTTSGEGGGTMTDTLGPTADDDDVLTGTGSALSVDSEEHFAMEVDLTATVDGVLSSLDQRDADALRQMYGLGGDRMSDATAAAGAAAVAAAGAVAGKRAVGRGRGLRRAAAPPQPAEGLGAPAAAMAGPGQEEAGGGDGADGQSAAATEQQQKAPGRRRLKTAVPSQRGAMQRLRERTAQDRRLQEWLGSQAARPEAPARSAGYARKSQ